MMTSSQTISETEQYDATAYLSGPEARLGDMTTEHEHSGIAAVNPADESRPRLPSLDLAEPTEPIFAETGWWESSSVPLADHPLLRGLLLELPPKGTNPPAAWLDRWFEATRSILELIYVQER